jgi:hypothetical protein
MVIDLYANRNILERAPNIPIRFLFSWSTDILWGRLKSLVASVILMTRSHAAAAAAAMAIIHVMAERGVPAGQPNLNFTTNSISGIYLQRRQAQPRPPPETTRGTITDWIGPEDIKYLHIVHQIIEYLMHSQHPNPANSTVYGIFQCLRRYPNQGRIHKARTSQEKSLQP